MTIEETLHPLTQEQLRLLANPLRLRILNLLCRREMSTAELQREIADAPSNLYHHVGKLADAGLLRLVRSEPRRGAVERYYRAVATGFTVPTELLAVGTGGAQPEIVATVRGMLEQMLAALAESFRAGLSGPAPPAEVPVINAVDVRASRERIDELRRRAEALTEEILSLAEEGGAEEGEEQGEEEVGYSFLLMLFPVAGDDREPRR